MNPVDEIKSRISIEQIIGDYIPLKKSGFNYKAVCPFHQEKTPSFMVSPEKQIWHCFGCNEGGDLFTFVEKYEGIDFKQAVIMLAQKAGVSVQGFSVQNAGKKNVLYDINENARELYAQELVGKTDDAKKTREYLHARGITDESITEWSLGLSPNSWEFIANALLKKFTAKDIIDAGLVIERDRRVHDRFRRRLMFPIVNAQGRVVAFTARTLHAIIHTDDEQAGKYVNSPQTAIYNKSQVLYGFYLARHDIRRLNYAIIVEGNTDVIMSHQAGIKNVVAVSGTALTRDQLVLLKRYTENIILSFDSDQAGSQAIFKGITMAWELGMNVKVLQLRDGKDPADVIHKDKELWRTAIKDSVGVVDFYFDAVLARVDVSRADHKKQATQKIMGIISQLNTQVEQEHYIKLLSKRLDLSERILWDLIQKPTHVKESAVSVRKDERSTGWQLISEYLICFVATHSEFLKQLFDDIEPDMLSEHIRELYKKIIIHYTQHHKSDLASLSRDLSETELLLWSNLIFIGGERYQHLTPQEQEIEFKQLVKRIREEYVGRTLRSISEEIERAERDGREDEVQSLLQRYKKISSQRNVAINKR